MKVWIKTQIGKSHLGDRSDRLLIDTNNCTASLVLAPPFETRLLVPSPDLDEGRSPSLAEGC